MEVFEGAESVLLPCQVPVSVSSGSTAVWDRDDFRIPTVHVRQPDGDYLKDQNQRYEELPSETVEIREGVKSVLLPLKANKSLPRDVRVEWTRPDQRNIRIHVCPEEQENIYEGRTKMKADPLRNGDLSLTLKTPQLEDWGL
ncbi:hypothetical protein CRENBAI_011505 [Crenichthys baileyi]|uniref:Uncharacterized protein n=1 Tax=Crenichthys baileyi TaxID=28760 RepID=A0AAV9QY65_9TELE